MINIKYPFKFPWIYICLNKAAIQKPAHVQILFCSLLFSLHRLVCLSLWPQGLELCLAPGKPWANCWWMNEWSITVHPGNCSGFEGYTKQSSVSPRRCKVNFLIAIIFYTEFYQPHHSRAPRTILIFFSLLLEGRGKLGMYNFGWVGPPKSES